MAVRGRPMKGREKRNVGVTVRLSAEEVRELDAAKKASGMSLPDLLLACVRGRLEMRGSEGAAQ